jgi:hypothetical protein
MSCETHRSASSAMSSGSSGTEDFSSMDPCCSVIHRTGHGRLRGTNHFDRRQRFSRDAWGNMISHGRASLASGLFCCGPLRTGTLRPPAFLFADDSFWSLDRLL